MKLNKYSIILPIVFCAVVYLISSFVANSFDIGSWPPEGRCVCGFLFFIAIVFGVMIGYEEY